MELSCIAKLFCQEMHEVRKGLVSLVAQLGESVKLLAEIYKSQFTKEIKNDQYLINWENFDVKHLTPILSNNISCDAACNVRLHVAFGIPVKLIYYINGYSAYLNQNLDLATECGFVFDVPVNPGDTLNFAVSFDTGMFAAARVKFLRLQEVR